MTANRPRTDADCRLIVEQASELADIQEAVKKIQLIRDGAIYDRILDLMIIHLSENEN